MAIVALAACHSDTTAPVSHSLVGDWSLRTIGGKSLPYDDGSGYITFSDVISLNTDGSYSELTHQRLGDRGDTTFRVTGTWSQQNDTTVLGTRADKSQWRVFWRGDSLTALSPTGVPNIYRR